MCSRIRSLCSPPGAAPIPVGSIAAIIGTVKDEPPGLVLQVTQLGAPASWTCWPAIPCRLSAGAAHTTA